VQGVVSDFTTEREWVERRQKYHASDIAGRRSGSSKASAEVKEQAGSLACSFLAGLAVEITSVHEHVHVFAVVMKK
jgi:hypothetical protein